MPENGTPHASAGGGRVPDGAQPTGAGPGAGDSRVDGAQRRRDRPRWVLSAILGGILAVLAIPGQDGPPAGAQACPPYCDTPVVTPAWHVHMCDEPYQEQLDDNHCMIGPGVTEFPAGTDTVYIIYCHQRDDTVKVFVRDSGGGTQYVNHPDGITYAGNGCETLVYRERNGIAPGGSPYFTSMHWPEGPFSGVGAGIEWYVGLFIAFDSDFYYGREAVARITARDPAANVDPTRRERFTVRVTSDSDPIGIPVELVEEAGGFSVFETAEGIRFSETASDPDAGVLKVAPHDEIRVSYCPRDCQTPYEDTATWIAIDATVTPTPLPTYAGPPPTATATPPPQLRVEYVTLRPAPVDVGYVPQKSANKSRLNHLGYPSMYVGMWTHGDNRHYGMVQFDLSSLPSDATITDARLELDGQSSDFTDPGEWSVKLLGASIDTGWREATYEQVRDATVLDQIGPTLLDGDLAPGRTNAFGFDDGQLPLVDDRLRGSGKISFRLDGPGGEDNNLFAWHTGVDVYERAEEPPDPALGPRLELGYSRVLPTATTDPSSPTPPPTSSATVTPLPTASPSATDGAGGTTPTATPGIDPTDSPTTPSTSTATPSSGPTGVPGDRTATATPPAPSATPSDPSDTPTPVGSATPSDELEGRQVCVVAFLDENGDGARDADERFMAGVTVRLRHEDSGAFVTWTTDGANDPDYCWAGLVDGRYTLSAVELPRDHVSSGAARVELTVPLPEPSITISFAVRPDDLPTPTPLASATVTATATETSIPTPTVRPTPTPQPTVVGPRGRLCVAAWEDLNRDSFRDPGEPLMDDVAVELEPDGTAHSSRVVRTRSDQPVCSVLPAGIWRAGVVVPPGRIVAGTAQHVVLLTDGGEITVGFALHADDAGRPVYLPFALGSRRPSR